LGETGDMKVLIVYSSVHHRNTEKIAWAIAEVLGADVVGVEDAKPEDILELISKLRILGVLLCMLWL